MDTKLLTRMTAEERVVCRKVLTQYKVLFEKIGEVLKDEALALDKELVLPPSEVENWALQQAYLRGEQAAYYRLIKLIETRHE